MKKNNLLKGNSKDVIDTNVKTLVGAGYSEANATRVALRSARKGASADRMAKKVAAPASGQVSVKGSEDY